jgi:hypothetical protein
VAICTAASLNFTGRRLVTTPCQCTAATSPAPCLDALACSCS